MANVQMLTLLSNFSICLHFFVIKSWGKKYRHTFMNCHLNGVDCSTCQVLAEPRRHPTQSRRPSLPRLRSGNPASASLHNALLPNSGEMVPGSQLSGTLLASSTGNAKAYRKNMFTGLKGGRHLEVPIISFQNLPPQSQLKVQALELALAWARSYGWPLPSSAYLARLTCPLYSSRNSSMYKALSKLLMSLSYVLLVCNWGDEGTFLRK